MSSAEEYITLRVKDYNQYDRLHNWVKKYKGKASSCSIDKTHKTTRYHWANISHKYKWDLDDFESLCPSCHSKKDFTPMISLLRSRAAKMNKNVPKKPVIKVYPRGSWIKFNSINEAARASDTLGTSISNVLAGRAKTAGGYKWKYVEVSHV